MRKRKAVVLLSGGIDSAVCLAIARKRRFEVYALSFDYGQRHKIEVKFAKKIAKSFSVKEHRIFKLDLKSFGGSSLLGNGEVPKDRKKSQLTKGIPSTYVPARNLIFLSIAMAWAEVLGARAVFIGAHTIDYSGYPDCRIEFLKSFEKTANLGLKAGVEKRKIKVVAPLAGMSKKDILRKGLKLGLDFSLTFSCYSPEKGGKPCGRCDSCLIRREAFGALGLERI